MEPRARVKALNFKLTHYLVLRQGGRHGDEQLQRRDQAGCYTSAAPRANHRQSPRGALLQRPAFAARHEPKLLHLDDQHDAEAIAKLGEIQKIRTKVCHLIGGPGALGGAELGRAWGQGQVLVGMHLANPGQIDWRPANVGGAFRRYENESTAGIRDQSAIEYVQWIRDRF